MSKISPNSKHGPEKQQRTLFEAESDFISKGSLAKVAFRLLEALAPHNILLFFGVFGVLFSTTLALVEPRLLGWIVDKVLTEKNQGLFLPAVLSLLILFCLKSAVLSGQNFIFSLLGAPKGI